VSIRVAVRGALFASLLGDSLRSMSLVTRRKVVLAVGCRLPVPSCVETGVRVLVMMRSLGSFLVLLTRYTVRGLLRLPAISQRDMSDRSRVDAASSGLASLELLDVIQDSTALELSQSIASVSPCLRIYKVNLSVCRLLDGKDKPRSQ
jgi:hypothetical protein